MNKSLLDFFSGKKVFITGHTGFKGSWLSYLLSEHGAIVKGYSKAPNTDPNLFDLLGLENKMESSINDINDFVKLEKAILDFEPEFILHLAAQPLVRYSYQNPLETHQTNIVGTANVLEAARKLKNVCSVICVTTDKVYKNKEWEFPYREIDELGGYDPYSSSKAAAELIISSYRESFFQQGYVQIASVRAGNVIGGGDWSKDRLIPDIVRSIAKGERVEIRNPNAIRPWQHVLDPLFGYLKLAMLMHKEPRRYEQAWNFGPKSNEFKSVLDVVNVFYAANNMEVDYQLSIQDKMHEAGILKLDISKSSVFLDWTPILNSQQAIEITARWYRSFLAEVPAEELVKQDINLFIK